MAEESPQRDFHTYHCLCTTLILASTHDLQGLPRRQEPAQDGALVLAPPIDITISDTINAEIAQSTSSVLLNVVPERRPVVVRREDGFEKRILLRCARCRLAIGYMLDESHFENDKGQAQSRPVFLLPGGLLSTADMVEGKQAETPLWAEQK